MTQHTPLTNALVDQRKHTLLFFQSSVCKLCRSIGGRVEEVLPRLSDLLLFCQAVLPGCSALNSALYPQERAQRESHLNLVHINTDGVQGFSPEVSLQGDHLMHSGSVLHVAGAGGLRGSMLL
jgi:hypothetical protein